MPLITGLAGTVDVLPMHFRDESDRVNIEKMPYHQFYRCAAFSVICTTTELHLNNEKIFRLKLTLRNAFPPYAPMCNDLFHQWIAGQIQILNRGRETALRRIVQKIVRCGLPFVRTIEIQTCA